jgi:mono/diheme cytochrome c family protein
MELTDQPARGELSMRNRRVSIAATAVAAGLLIGSCASAALAQSSGELARRGEELAARECATCHPVQGGSPVQKAPPFREIARRMDVETLKRGLTSGVLSGHPTMPRLGLDPGQIDAIATYIGSLREP